MAMGNQPPGVSGVRSKSSATSIKIYQGQQQHNMWAFDAQQMYGRMGYSPGGRGQRPGGPGTGREGQPGAPGQRGDPVGPGRQLGPGVGPGGGPPPPPPAPRGGKGGT